MHVVLFALNASYVHTNLAIRCLAEPLLAAGHQVTMLEYHLKDRKDAVLHALYQANADVYGFSVYIWNRDQILSLAQDLKTLRPQCRIICGGPEVSFAEESFFTRYPFVDEVIRGEGEEVFPRLLNQPPQPHTFHTGTPYADFVHTGIHYTQNHLPNGGIVYYESSRGCPYRCAYCLSAVKTLSGEKIRAKSAECTLAQLSEFEAFENIRVIKFVDRTFNFSPQRAVEIWDALRSDKYTKHYHFEICASLLNEAAFAILAKMPAGKIQFEIGVQSTNPKTLEAVDRHDQPQTVLANIRRLYEMGNIHIHTDLIAGLPYEDFARFGQSFDALFGNCHQLQLGFLKLLPGSPLAAHAPEYAYRAQKDPPYEILENRFLSYEELTRLHAVDRIQDRFVNSGRFARAIRRWMDTEPSAFAAFCAFADKLAQNPASISQIAAYEALYQFALARIPQAAQAFFHDALALDFLQWETGPLPQCIRVEPIQEPALRHAILPHLKSVFPNLQPSALFFCRLSSTPGKVTVVDRKQHLVTEIPEPIC